MDKIDIKRERTMKRYGYLLVVAIANMGCM